MISMSIHRGWFNRPWRLCVHSCVMRHYFYMALLIEIKGRKCFIYIKHYLKILMINLFGSPFKQIVLWSGIYKINLLVQANCYYLSLIIPTHRCRFNLYSTATGWLIHTAHNVINYIFRSFDYDLTLCRNKIKKFSPIPVSATLQTC